MGKSARIQRREACKTGTVPVKQCWVKTTEYGDYQDPLQNHKFDGELHFKNDDVSSIVVRTKMQELLNHCRTLGTHGKHIGSKSYKKLISPLKRLNKSRETFNKFIKNSKQNNNVSDTDKQ